MTAQFMRARATETVVVADENARRQFTKEVIWSNQIYLRRMPLSGKYWSKYLTYFIRRDSGVKFGIRAEKRE